MITYKGIKLHKGQQRILKEILNSDAKYHIINASRQWGKSVFASQMLLYYSINNPRARCLYATPIHAQAKKVYTDILQAIIKSGVVKEHNKSDMTMTLINGSYIRFTGTEKYDNLRGESIRFMILDEFAFMKPEAFETTLKQMMNAQKYAKCLMISTPKGKKNHFYKYAQFGISNEKLNYTYHKGIYLDNPFYNLSEVEDAKQNLPDYIFKQEYLGEFIDLGGILFENIDDLCILNKYSQKTERNFAGLDLGRQNDWTVLTILNSNGEIVFSYRDQLKSWESILNNVAHYLREYNCNCLVEINGVGDPLFDMLKSKYSNIEPWQTTNKTKQDIIERLMVDFQNRSIKLLSQKTDNVYYNELINLEVEYNQKTRTIKYSAPTGLHDDCVISLALANYNKNNNKNYGRYYIE